MKLYLVRHGETLLNKEFRFIGRTDSSLSQEGIAQAGIVADQLKNARIKAVYSSDLIRARHTAEIIASPHGLEVEQVRDLREIDFGQWEGLTYDEIKASGIGQIDPWLEDPISIEIPRGETWDGFKDRVADSIKKITEKDINGDVVVVTHGGPIKLLMGYFQSGDWELSKTVWLSPGGMSIITIP